ncbi:nuclear transport factor 2 family protein [Fluviispira vulneris]|uniref:nuclear transport factor 2 family protein n=1 Tax=Fluviispira vulneris TaxID=2763012 RepID=UPI001648E83C|nr:nuclear transport factor 2 family protein [Fluviispira vulneris]
MINKNLDMALNYYSFVVQKKINEIEKLLHPDVEFISPIKALHGKENVTPWIADYCNFAQEIEVRAKFSHDDQVMLAFDLTSVAGKSRAAVLMTFLNQSIKKIELFFDASPFLNK